MKRRRRSFWIALAFVLAGVALVVDQTTGDDTGPPYHDPFINKLAFFVFMTAMLALITLCVAAAVAAIRASAQLRRR